MIAGTLPIWKHLLEIVAVVVSAAKHVADFMRKRLAAFGARSFLAAKPGGQQANVRDDDTVAADLRIKSWPRADASMIIWIG